MKEFFQISALLAILCNTVIALLIVWRGHRASATRAYLLWAIALLAWNVGFFFALQAPYGPPGSPQEKEGLYWVYVLQCGAILIPITNLHLTLLIAQVNLRRLLGVLYALFLGLLVSLFTGHFIRGVHYAGYAWYSNPGPMFSVYMALYVVTTTIIMTILFVKQRTLSPLHRTRLRALIVAFSILLVFGTNDLLPIIGYERYPLLGLPVYPLGIPAAIVYNIIVGYTVLQHHLLDIHLTLSQVASFLVQLVFNLILGFLCLSLLWLFFPAHLGGWVFLGVLGVVAASNSATALLFPRLLGRGGDALERRILGDRFAYHDHLRSYIQRVRAHPNPESMVQELHDLFTASVGMQSFQIIMADDTTQAFTMVHSHPERLLGPIPSLDRDCPLFRYFQGQHPGYLAIRMAYSMPGETELEHAARQQLIEFNPEFCFPLFYEKQIFGLLLAGPKSNQDPYTPQDLRLLVELARNLSLLLNQVRLKNQIQAAQEQELLGRMSRGLAHDLNNLITPAQTFLQLCAQGLMNQEAIEELLPVAMRNVDTIRSYISEALFFSRTHRLEVKPARIDEIIRAAIDLMELRARGKAIEFRVEGLAPIVIELDEVMIQRLLGNLLANAIDASPPRSPIQIHLIRLPRTDSHRDWVRVKVVDFGSGISRENLERVFTPYFTTKDRGDGNRGFGLGLAIARKIVHLHGGNLRIASVEKRGTTVEVDLPSRNAQAATDVKTQAMTATVRP